MTSSSLPRCVLRSLSRTSLSRRGSARLTARCPGVAVELVLARTEKVAVYVLTLFAYPTGFQFDVTTISADRWNDELDPMMFGPQHHRAHRDRGENELPAEMLRIGVQFADGAKATNTAGLAGLHRDQAPPPGPVMHGGGGGGGGGQWHQTQWVWPLPPPGSLSFVCEWPAAGIPLTRSEIDAQTILAAAGRAQPLFPDQPPAQGSQPAAGPPMHHKRPARMPKAQLHVRPVARLADASGGAPPQCR